MPTDDLNFSVETVINVIEIIQFLNYGNNKYDIDNNIFSGHNLKSHESDRPIVKFCIKIDHSGKQKLSLNSVKT